MTRRGRKRRLETESLYWQLILSGVGTVQACQEAGIGRKTGYRWRAENGGLPPGRVAEDVRSGGRREPRGSSHRLASAASTTRSCSRLRMGAARR
jgi:hypothetical protein